MTISWHGQSCFEITAGTQKNGPVKIVIDPFSEEIGLKLPKLSADILLVTHDHPDHNNIKAVSPSAGTSGQAFLISGPGEYEAKGVYVRGIPSFHDQEQGKERGQNCVYVIEAEELKLCHLGDFGQKELTSEQVEQIGEVDVLMIPVGGNYTISSAEAAKTMAQIEPRITIPVHYALPKLKVKLDGLDKFLKTLGIKSAEPLSKLTVKKKDLPTDEAKIIVLTP